MGSARSKGGCCNKKRLLGETAEDLVSDEGGRVGWSRVKKVSQAGEKTYEARGMLKDEEKGGK